MNLWHIYFRPTDGEICGWCNSPVPEVPAGLLVSTIDVPDGAHFWPDPKLHKIDLVTHELIDKSPEEQALANAVTIHEVNSVIYTQLKNSDEVVVPDRPLSDVKRAAWVTYRQALRDLSKPHDTDDPTRRPTPADMIRAWPMHPSGIDPIPSLRERLG